MANVGEVIPECDGTGTSGDPYRYKNATGFKNAIAVTNAYVEANENNMVFDVNDGVLSATCNLYCKSLNGKGTIIRNLYANATNSVLISPKAHGVTYSNINFYNMLILISGTNGRSAAFYRPGMSSGGSGDYPVVWNNCNFTGVVKGNMTDALDGIINGALGSGIYAYTKFNNCTFNINFGLTKTNNSNANIIYGDGGKLQLNNCTIQISGKITAQTNNADYYLCINATLTNCTFMNKQNNPFIIDGAKAVPRYAPTDSSGYNYFKMYMQNTYTSSPPDFMLTNADKTLFNISRITGMNSLNGTAIKMQETNPSSPNNDYIYNAENLAAKGFPIGTTIE